MQANSLCRILPSLEDYLHVKSPLWLNDKAAGIFMILQMQALKSRIVRRVKSASDLEYAYKAPQLRRPVNLSFLLVLTCNFQMNVEGSTARARSMKAPKPMKKSLCQSLCYQRFHSTLKGL